VTYLGGPPAAAAAWGRRARRAAHDRFHWAGQAEILLGLYRGLAPPRPAGLPARRAA
jgi:hypothetical protein